MKTKLFLFLISSILFSSLTAQVRFEKGYFIDNSGSKTECLIRNVGWRSNPDFFEYKFNENEEIKKGEIATIKEFGIHEDDKYIRETLDIELSSVKTNDLTPERKLNFVNKTVFLKVLAEGKANLYSYREGDIIKYFYSTDNSEIEQLIYQLFLRSEISNRIIENREYRNKLNLEVSCGNKRADNIDYEDADLINYFNAYNECSGSGTAASNSIYKSKIRKSDLNIYAKIALENNQFDLSSSSISSYDFDNKTSLAFGFEVENIFPFANNKWALLFSGMYNNVTIKGDRVRSVENTIAEVNYKSIELGIGPRYFIYLNDNSMFFFEGLVNMNLPLGDNENNLVFIFEPTDVNPEGSTIESGIGAAVHNNYSFGAGFKYNIGYIKVNYVTKNRIFDRNVGISSNLSKITITAGFQVL